MKGFTLWFTGLPCSGKSTLARQVEDVLLERGVNVEVLDGDEVRENLSKGLTFSKEDRDINIRRIGWVCRLLHRNGAVAISAAISPYKAIRQEVRDMHDRFVEVYVRVPVEVCKERDVKGMYKLAAEGKIKGFTGVDDPYEEPANPEIVVDTDKESEEESLNKIIRTLELMQYIPGVTADSEYSEEEEEKIKSRLKDLGYI
jgi:adenylylsulfate kinase